MRMRSTMTVTKSRRGEGALVSRIRSRSPQAVRQVIQALITTVPLFTHMLFQLNWSAKDHHVIYSIINTITLSQDHVSCQLPNLIKISGLAQYQPCKSGIRPCRLGSWRLGCLMPDKPGWLGSQAPRLAWTNMQKQRGFLMMIWHSPCFRTTFFLISIWMTSDIMGMASMPIVKIQRLTKHLQGPNQQINTAIFTIPSNVIHLKIIVLASHFVMTWSNSS